MTRSGGARPFYGWKLALLLWLALAINFALSTYGLSILNVHMGDELQFSRGAQGMAYALFMLMTGLPGPLVAKLIDRVGIRYTLALGNLLLALGAVAMATVVTSPLLLLLVAGIVIGSANAAGGPITVQASVTRWFSRRRALAMALVISGSSISGMISAPLLEHIVAVTGSWRDGWWLIAGLAGIAVAFCLAFVIEHPADIGQQPDGDALPEDPTQHAASRPPARVYLTNEDWTARDVVRTPAFWLLLSCSIGVSAVFTIFLAQGMLQMRDLGYSTGTAAYMISFSVGMGFATHLLVGLVADRIDPRKIWAAALLFQAVGIALFAGAADQRVLYVAVACIGMGSHAAILSLIMVYSNWFGQRAAPFVFGFGSAFSALFGALAPIASGYCYDRIGSFAPVFQGIALLCAIGALALILLRPPRIVADSQNLTIV